MPRRRESPRLYLDPVRRTWTIKDGPTAIRTGFSEVQRAQAEQMLGIYLGKKYEPPKSNDPLILDVLVVYGREHLPHTLTAKRNGNYAIGRLAKWWNDKRASAINAATCREYARGWSDSTARRDLETLRAACRYYAEVMSVPLQVRVVLPPKHAPRQRWLTRQEAARLLKAARPWPHLARFILIGLYTGNRPGVTRALTWQQVDLTAGVMHRRPYGAREHAKKRTPPVRLGRKF
jgi:integrase